MKLGKWFEIVEADKEDLRHLIATYHPSNLEPHKPADRIPMDITAPNAERACEVCRDQIRQERMLECPEVQFDIALQKRDYETLHLLFSDTWFGVPESTSCWQLSGFSVMVDLLDDPPEEIS